MKNKINLIGVVLMIIGIALIIIGMLYSFIGTIFTKNSSAGKNLNGTDNVIEITVNNEYEVQVNDILKINEDKYRVIGVKSVLNSDGSCNENNTYFVVQNESDGFTMQRYLTPREEDVMAMDTLYITISKCSEDQTKIFIKTNQYRTE